MFVVDSFATSVKISAKAFYQYLNKRGLVTCCTRPSFTCRPNRIFKSVSRFTSFNYIPCTPVTTPSEMDKIQNVSIKPLGKSIYLQPKTMHFTQNNLKRTWDLLEVHDSVAILIHNTQRNTLVFVKQFRPSVYFSAVPPEDRTSEIDVNKYPPSLGITLELCAGLVDKDESLEEIAKEEILEECGYGVPLGGLIKIGSYRSGVGTLGSLQTTYYCEVVDEMKVAQGGGVGDEIIEVVEMTVPEIKKYLAQDKIPSPPSFLFGIYWFLHHKAL